MRAAGHAETVGGVPARWVAEPATVAEAAEVLRDASERDLAVVPRGAGTKLDRGVPPSRVDIVLDTRRLAGVVDHAPGDLVVTALSGTPLSALQSAVAPAGQRLALDPPSTGAGATIGGVLAAGEAGPLRTRFGSGRDVLIGVEFVRADGVVAHAGGRVVKNVAGYDLGKLLCGSHGTLGLITSATFRLHPIPAARAWVSRAVTTPLEAHDLVGEVLASPVAPTAVELDLAGTGTLAVLLEGSTAGVAARAARLAAAIKGSTEDRPPDWWGRYPFAAGDVVLELSVPIADLHAAVYALRDAAGAPVPVRGSAGAGVVVAVLPGPDRLADVLAAVRGVLVGRGGSCVVLSAPPDVSAAADVWGPVSGLALMRNVKDRFDPRRLLSPGRFVGGL